jgi:hypothetical protein
VIVLLLLVRQIYVNNLLDFLSVSAKGRCHTAEPSVALGETARLSFTSEYYWLSRVKWQRGVRRDRWPRWCSHNTETALNHS